jgi:hypothetical protein
MGKSENTRHKKTIKTVRKKQRDAEINRGRKNKQRDHARKVRFNTDDLVTACHQGELVSVNTDDLTTPSILSNQGELVIVGDEIPETAGSNCVIL